uniref:TIGR01777 family protein n=1 Tax=Schlesneria paludicola TaxID=360056 RepID=A0A7C4LNA3_9PLAN
MTRRRVFQRRSRLACSAETAFRWHERPGALQRLMPPWEQAEVVSATGNLRPGSRVVLRMRVGPVRCTWVAEHRDYVAGREFRDVQVAGPFAVFDHIHRITPAGKDACWLDDCIEYAIPGGWLGNALAGRYVERQLSRMFTYRHAVTAADLALHSKGDSMKVLVTGATGLVGRHVVPLLTTQGHDVLRLTRRTPTEPNDVVWNPERGDLPSARLEGLDAVVHLAGENIASGRWTPTLKERIRSSRVDGTRLLCTTLARLQHKPKTLVCASAIGFYGDRGAELLTEDSPLGNGFLPDVCRAWEAACAPALDAGIRVVNLRIGVVLSPQGGALAQMLLPFRCGLGGVVGSGKQYLSWIAIDDVGGAILHCLQHQELSGPVNATAPHPVTNHEFTKTLGGVLNRPTIFPVPAFAAKLLMGEMAEELLLSSTRVEPRKLLQSGYVFRFPFLDEALRHVLGRGAPASPAA